MNILFFIAGMVLGVVVVIIVGLFFIAINAVTK